MTPTAASRTAAALLTAALSGPFAGPLARLEARRAAITVLGGGDHLHGQRTEDLVTRARAVLAAPGGEA